MNVAAGDGKPLGRLDFHVYPTTEPMEKPWVDGLTIGQALRQTAERFGDQDACVFCQNGPRLSWREFDQAVDRAARGLLALGFGHGDHLGVWATNVPQWLLLQFATARIGVVLVTINPAYRSGELAYALAQSQVRGLALVDQFKSSDYHSMLALACPELPDGEPGRLSSDALPDLRWVISMRGPTQPGMIGWDELLDRADQIPVEQLDDAIARLTPNDPINIQYTSGTTGRPKGAMLSHRNILLNAYYCGQYQQLNAADRICITVPLYHCFGCVLGTLCASVSGAAMIFPGQSFHAGETLEAIETQRCTAVYGVPTMFIALLEHQRYGQTDLCSLRTGIMAGSPCPIELMKRVTHQMGAREVTIAYGQTESSPLITQTRTDDPLELRVGTVGRPIPGVEVKIIDPDTGETLPDMQQGELCTRGHNVMLGYYNMPENTAAAIDADGWLHTGDLATRQPDGYYRITGRRNDMIIRGGENVYPREIEEHLYQHPAVEDVQVVGVPDRLKGEEVSAWIKLRQGQQATESEIRDFCRQALAHFKVPRYVRFVESFPTTVNGKIQKFIIRQQAIKELGLEDAADIETA